MKPPKSKDELVSDLHSKIDGASRKIDELKLQTALAKADSRDAFEKRISHLEERRDKLKGDLNGLKDSAGEAWKDLAAGCETSWKEFKDAVSKAMDEFKS